MVDLKKIGVVILNYKDADTTIQLCQNICNYLAIDHIVVVDNCSTDDSYERLLLLKNSKIDVLKSNKNGGYSYGNNFGAFYLIKNYKIDILYIANPDVEFDENFIESTSRIIISSKAQAVSGIMINRDGSNGINDTIINSYFDDLLDCTIFLKKLFARQKKKVSRGEGIVQVQYLYGSLFAIDVNIFKKIGGFDENVFLYCEERILGTKLKQKNSVLAIDTSIEFKHIHAVSINKSVSKINQVKQLYKSRQYYHKTYEKTGKIKNVLYWFLSLYGITVRKIIYKMGSK